MLPRYVVPAAKRQPFAEPVKRVRKYERPQHVNSVMDVLHEQQSTHHYRAKQGKQSVPTTAQTQKYQENAGRMAGIKQVFGNIRLAVKGVADGSIRGIRPTGGLSGTRLILRIRDRLTIR